MGCAERSAPGDDSAGSSFWHVLAKSDDGLARTVLVIRPGLLLLPALQVLRQPRREPSSHPPKLGPGSLVILAKTLRGSLEAILKVGADEMPILRLKPGKQADGMSTLFRPVDVPRIRPWWTA